MVDLSTTYLGLKLDNPLIASSSPMSKKLDTVRKMEDAGISALVMYSLFEEQIEHESRSLDHFLSVGSESYAEAITYFPDLGQYNIGHEEYLNLIQKYKKSVQIPIIASLNGISSGGWISYAKKMEQAGADALEINIYYVPTEPDLESQELEEAYINLVKDLKAGIHIPLAVKLSPYFTTIPNFAHKLVKAGADGLVLFNRFYQPDLDIESLEVVPNLDLSTSADLRLPLRWIAILHGRLDVDLALTSGIHTGNDIIKAVMAGANVAMSASALIQHGCEKAKEMLSDLEKWMELYDYSSIEQMRGSMSQKSIAEPAAFERANYMKALRSFDNRLGI